MAKPEIRVYGVSQKLCDKFESLVHITGLSKKEMLEKLIDAYLASDSQNGNAVYDGLSDSDKVVVDTARGNGANIGELLALGLVAESKRWNSNQGTRDKFASLGFDDLGKITGVKGVSEERIRRTVQACLNHNESAQSPEDRVFITQSFVFKLSGSNRQTIKTYFEKPEIIDSLEKHHSEMGLTPDHNRKSRQISQIELSIKGELINFKGES